MLKYVLEILKENYSHELELLKVTLPSITSIPSIKFIEAKELISRKYKRTIRDYDDFEPEEEKLLTEIFKKEYSSDFVFVTHYPRSKRPFYAMEDPSNPDEQPSFDLLFRGLEITTVSESIITGRYEMKRLNMNIELFEAI